MRGTKNLMCSTLRLKDKFYKIMVRPTMCYGFKCWIINKKHIQKFMLLRCECWDEYMELLWEREKEIFC